MTNSEKLIAKLVDEGKITGEQAILLMKINRGEKESFEENNIPPDKQFIYLNEQQNMCIPCADKLKKGEPAVCGCTLYTPKIT